jgi:hypothetical protein
MHKAIDIQLCWEIDGECAAICLGAFTLNLYYTKGKSPYFSIMYICIFGPLCYDYSNLASLNWGTFHAPPCMTVVTDVCVS